MCVRVYKKNKRIKDFSSFVPPFVIEIIYKKKSSGKGKGRHKFLYSKDRGTSSTSNGLTTIIFSKFFFTKTAS